MNINPTHLPNWSRYKALFRNGNNMSVLRSLQYEILKEIDIRGNVLDFGGGRKAGYLEVMKLSGDYDSVNIDPSMEPSWVTGVDEPIPCDDSLYDTVISMNTVEHIYNACFAISEMHRVLKSDGDFICFLPFLYPIHAHPDDYFRPTASWWGKTLENTGFKDISVTPLLWGPFTTGLACSGVPGPFKVLRKRLMLCMDIIYARLRFKGQDYYANSLGNIALGYYIRARKK